MSGGITTGEVHGENGAYVGGYWVPIDDCVHDFNIKDASHHLSGPARRSITSHTAAKADGSYDVAIIGSGCIGAAVARELAKTDASVVMLEAADDVCQGATKGNSGIVHAGYDDTPGSVRAKLCWKGNQMFAALDRDLHFGYQLTGSLVVARGAEEEAHLHELLARGHTNGVENLRIIRRDELFTMEPNLDEACTAALFSPDAGTLIPYEYTIALAENAADNGVEVRIRREVHSISEAADGLLELSLSHWEPKEVAKEALNEKKAGWLNALRPRAKKAPPAEGALGNYYGGEDEGGPWQAHPELKKEEQKVSVADMKVGGSGSRRAMGGVVVGGETVRARFVVNAAGGASDKIAKMIGDESFEILPRLGEYVLLKKSSGAACNHILFPCPGPLGKGILVQKTLWGNLILGPTARDQKKWADPEVDPDSKEEILSQILTACKRLVPSFDVNDAFHSFAGARAKSTRGDWIIERSAADARVVHAAGIDSPGIAGSPAIALEVVELLEQAGLDAKADPAFNPKRAPLIVPKSGDEVLVQSAPDAQGESRVERLPLVYTADDKTAVNAAGVDAAVNVVCKCEKVTEAEVVAACRRSLPVDSTQGIRKRTRAGMGGCQGKPWNYGCECRVAQIVARERKSWRESLETRDVGRRPWAATSQFPRRWLSQDDKDLLVALSQPEEPGDVPEGAPTPDAATLEDKVSDALPLKVELPAEDKSATA